MNKKTLALTMLTGPLLLSFNQGASLAQSTQSVQPKAKSITAVHNTHSAKTSTTVSAPTVTASPVIIPAIPMNDDEAAAIGGEGGKMFGLGKHKVASDFAPQEKIPCLRWADETIKPRAVLFCIHGLGLHKGCYEDFGKAMAKQGLVVYAIDVRGFGEWMTKGKNDTIDFDGTMSDIKRALVQIRAKNPGLPVIVLGESMGGGIGLHATAQFPELIDGLVSSVPAGDRFGATEGKLKVGMHAIFGMDKKMDVGTGVIKQATKKADLREKWGQRSALPQRSDTG